MRNLFLHLLLIRLFPDSLDVPHWSKEVANWHAELGTRATPAMLLLIGTQSVWERAVRDLRVKLQGLYAIEDHRAVALRLRADEPCPYEAAEFCGPALDLPVLLARMFPGLE